jgi:hypothetical protein
MVYIFFLLLEGNGRKSANQREMLWKIEAKNRKVFLFSALEKSSNQ